MNNLVLLCPFHHRAVHEGGWRVEMDEWGAPRFFNPLGVRMPTSAGGPGHRRPSAPRRLADTPEALARIPEAFALAPEISACTPDGLPGTDARLVDTVDKPLGALGGRLRLGRWHGRDGIDAWTGTTLWRGERLD